MNYPMLEKYIDETVGGNWFIFGIHKNGNVDVSSANDDVFTDLPTAQAERIVKIRNEFLNKLYEVIGFDAQKNKQN